MSGRPKAQSVEAWLKSPRISCHVIPGTEPLAIIDIFGKLLPERPFTFFLSHFHSDHYTGIQRNWSRGFIHCSVVTGRMLSRILYVKPSVVNGLKLGVEYDLAGAKVTLVDANHCPGAVMFLFKTRDGKVYLHTGDFRFDMQMLRNPLLRQTRIDILFLDTTYADPNCNFVSQSDSILQAVEIADKAVANANGQSKRNLFLVGAYTTGKEKVAFALAEAHGWKIYANARRRCILDCQDLSDKKRALLTTNPAEAEVHLVPMNTIGSVMPYFRPNFTRVQQYLRSNKLDSVFQNVIGFLPTGWSFTTKWNKDHAVVASGNVTIHLLEYSEHSSFSELKAFVTGLDPMQVIPTVFSSDTHYNKLVEAWQPGKLASSIARGKEAVKRRRFELAAKDENQPPITAFFRAKNAVSTASSTCFKKSMTTLFDAVSMASVSTSPRKGASSPVACTGTVVESHQQGSSKEIIVLNDD